jgi:hypothetical protein
MDKIIKKTIEYLKSVPSEYQAVAFPIIFEHQLLEIRRQNRMDDKKR